MRRTVLAVLAVVVVTVLARAILPLVWSPRLAPPNRTPTAGAPRTYDAALARARQQVEGARAIAAQHPGEWLQQERLAVAHVARARLTGSFDDYAAAQAALDQAFAHAPTGSGPHLTQASLDMSLHRLAHARAMLDAIGRYAVPPERDDADEIAGMRGDIDFYSGRYAQAWARYGGDKASSAGGFRQAVYQGRTGHIDAALASLDALERGMRFATAQSLANLALQRGELELQRGRWAAAGEHFARAERLLPGSWLAQAHTAQMLALFGDRRVAIAQMTAVANRSGAPEAMDALAALYRAEGDAAHSRVWSDRAGVIWARRLAQIPEAAWGHAVEHELAFGEPARALDLAARDYAARPYGATAVAVAWALIANARPAEALAVLKPVMASPYVSAEQHAAAAQAHAFLGQGREAAAERKLALAINPHALDRDAALIWFGH